MNIHTTDNNKRKTLVTIEKLAVNQTDSDFGSENPFNKSIELLSEN